MSDWQPGDLALCINTNPIDTGAYVADPTGLVSGRVYEVERPAIAPEDGALLLVLVGDDCDDIDIGRLARRFRKVTPDKADEWDRETIALMNGAPVPADMLSGVRS